MDRGRNGAGLGLSAAGYLRINKRTIAHAFDGQLFVEIANAIFHDFDRHKALNISAELSKIFSHRAGAFLLQRSANDTLW